MPGDGRARTGKEGRQGGHPSLESLPNGGSLCKVIALD